MPLLTNPQLEASPIVANNRMNRERNLAGSNGYDRELRLHPLERLADVVRRRGQASSLVLCCGTGRALVEAAQQADVANLPLTIVGVDLAGLFFPASSPRLVRHEASLTDWQPDRFFDLITCVHGLHYIGDKLDLLARAAGWLTDDDL
ncbi:MAG TPA: class I SAM-dependent methyltransferase, partial [Planctomycetaceae bacterium]|nr:class I SAM-dependent methyltransferase [Planctomycetaceae bacterium]